VDELNQVTAHGDPRRSAGPLRPQDFVISVDSVPSGVERRLARGNLEAVLVQKGQAFVPHVLAVAKGTVVHVHNQDRVFHNTFSVAKPRRFDLGRYPPGDIRSVEFDTVGVAHLFCEIHADMDCFVKVIPHHGFAQPGPDGAFALPRLGPGEYRLQAWHPTLGETSSEVTVPPRERVSVEIGFTGARPTIDAYVSQPVLPAAFYAVETGLGADSEGPTAAVGARYSWLNPAGPGLQLAASVMPGLLDAEAIVVPEASLLFATPVAPEAALIPHVGFGLTLGTGELELTPSVGVGLLLRRPGSAGLHLDATFHDGFYAVIAGFAFGAGGASGGW
jgi:plastocyanin